MSFKTAVYIKHVHDKDKDGEGITLTAEQLDEKKKNVVMRPSVHNH